MPSFSVIWYQITRPHLDVEDRVERERARLLAGLVLAFLALQLLLLIFVGVRYGVGEMFLGVLISCAVTAIIYALSRSTRYFTGILLLAALSLSAVLAANSVIPDPHVSSIILLPVLLVALLWSAPMAIVMALMGIAGVLIIGLQNDTIDLLLSYYMPINLMLAVLIIVAAYLIQQSRLRIITQHRQTKQQRRELELEQERLGLLLGLISQLSHDLMTPLTIMNTSTYLMGRIAKDDNRIQHHLKKLGHETERLENMIQDLVVMSRLDRLTPDDFEFKRHNVRKIVERVAEKYSRLATRVGCTLKIADGPDDLLANVDEAVLYRALANILDSAIHNVDQGGVINLELHGDDQNVCMIITSSGSRSISGLGPDIARTIIAAHSGTLDIESPDDDKTVIRLTLPAA